MVTKILDHLYLGDLQDAQKFEGTVICVMQELVHALEPMKAYWIPIIRTSKVTDDNFLLNEQGVEITALPHQLDMVSAILVAEEIGGRDTLVHCMAGIERSPLAIAHYLHTYKNMTWDKAYKFIQDKRPEVANRLPWLNMSYEQRMS